MSLRRRRRINPASAIWRIGKAIVLTAKISIPKGFYLLNRSISVRDIADTPVEYAGTKSGAKLLL